MMFSPDLIEPENGAYKYTYQIRPGCAFYLLTVSNTTKRINRIETRNPGEDPVELDAIHYSIKREPGVDLLCVLILQKITSKLVYIYAEE